MSAKRVFTLMIAVLIIVLLAVPVASAQSATNQVWTSSITYYTPSATGGQLTVDYYAGTNKYSASPITLNPHKAGSLFIGNVSSVPDGFAGSAVLSASVPIVATYVQFVSGTASAEYGRMLYNGFSTRDAAETFYVPTVLYQKFGSTSRIGVQNVESTNSITAQLKFYAVGATTPTATKNVTIPVLASYIFSPADIAGLAPGFNGSLVVTTVGTGGGKVVAASEETNDNGRAAYAFEGVAQGANTVYMASMLCEYRPEKQTSYYAIQNAGQGNASVKATFYNTLGAVVGTMAPTNIAQGAKLSIQPCQFGVAAGTSGSAVIESTGAPIIAIAKVSATNGLVTAFVGQGQGSTQIAAPYVRWAKDPAQDFRAYIAVMNIGSASAQNIQANYYDGNGTLVATHALATAAKPLGRFIKTNTDPANANALNATYGDFGFHPAGGAIEFTSDQPIVVVARLARNVNLGAVTMFGEDYNGVSVE